MKRNRILLHLGFWLLATLFFAWFYTKLTQEYQHTLILVGVILPVSIGTVYFFNFFLIPKYLFTKRYLSFAIYSGYAVIVSIWSSLLLVIVYFTILLTQTGGYHFPFEIDVSFMMAGQYLVIAAGVLGHAIRENFRSINLRNELENQRLEFQSKLMESELRFMKTQFHPHFLFNTLNNLYSLSLKKSDDAPGMILKLSELLDYSLHAANNDQVSLSAEISFIQNYFDIARMRFGEKLNFKFDIEIDNKEYLLPPLLLMPFVENAVKHGISPDRDQNWIRISLVQHPHELTFKIENSTLDAEHYTLPRSDSSGIGLEQVRNRLKILLPDRHDLSISKEEQRFSVTLIING